MANFCLNLCSLSGISGFQTTKSVFRKLFIRKCLLHLLHSIYLNNSEMEPWYRHHHSGSFPGRCACARQKTVCENGWYQETWSSLRICLADWSNCWDNPRRKYKGSDKSNSEMSDSSLQLFWFWHNPEALIIVYFSFNKRISQGNLI